MCSPACLRALFRPSHAPPCPQHACSFLLSPLAQLDGALQQAGKQPPTVMLLLDALDESDDAGKGWESVARLVAKECVVAPGALWQEPHGAISCSIS